jgi:DNA-binding LytR/AlgR family response regulator
VTRLKEKLAAAPPQLQPDMAEVLRRLLNGFTVEDRPQRIRYLRVQQGDAVRLIPVEDVIYFKASDKYTEVITRQGEALIRKPVKDLAGELDPGTFWQIHRGTIVNVRFIARVSRSLTGSGTVKLTGRDEALSVSSRYMHLFKQGIVVKSRLLILWLEFSSDRLIIYGFGF